MSTTTARDFDFENSEPSYWAKHAWWMQPLAAFVLTTTLTVFSFPPFHAKAYAFIFAVPMIFWAFTGPRLKTFAIVMFASQAVSWTILLSWLHNVTWLGMFLLGPFIGAWVGVWYLAVWWVVQRLKGKPLMVRAPAMLGLAGLWVFNEWLRTWVLGGFPWLPLAASQWQNSALLQVASYTGQSGISFVLITFNYAVASYLNRLFRERHLKGLRKRSPEFTIALLLLLVSALPLLRETMNQDRKHYIRTAFVQPYIPQSVKWNPDNARLSFDVLGELTMVASASAPELILWPEAAPPYAVKGWDDSEKVRNWIEDLSRRAKAPLLIGAVAEEQTEAAANVKDPIYNEAFVVTPEHGLNPKGYAKRQLVPFGEYVPLRPVLGWLKKFTDVSSSDTLAGTSATPLHVTTRSGHFAAGVLICYEDIFPNLAVANAYAGAEALVVLTNNGWFGEGGAAYQHAAHSVLRAVETRRPVLRCGNGGWSGWIDEYGNTRVVLQNRNKSIYFRGTQTYDITRDMRWVGQDSFYVKHGDWFVLLCAVLTTFGYAMLLFYKTRDVQPFEIKE